MQRWSSYLGVIVVVAPSMVACGGSDDGSAPSAAGAAGTGGAGNTGSGGATTGGVSSAGAVPPAAACPATVSPCTPTVLDQGLSGPGAFQVADGFLYWRVLPVMAAGTNRDPNSVLRLRLPDGGPEVVTSLGAGSLNTFAIDATHIYVGDATLGIGRVPRDGGTVEYLDDVPAYQVLLDATHIYYGTVAGTGNALARLPKAGGEPEVIAEVPSATLVAIDDTHVYWPLETEATFVLFRAPKTGGEPETLSNDVPMRPERLMLFEHQVYFAINRPLPTTLPRGVVMRYPAVGGPATEVGSVADSIAALAVDADSFYFGTCPGVAGQARVYKLPHAGGTPTPIAEGGTCFAGLTVDATRVYFAEWGAPDYAVTGDGQVLAADKCGCAAP